MTVSKILVPVDFSEYSERALDYAVALSKQMGASLHLVHVYPSMAYVAPPMMSGPVMVGQFRDQSAKAFDDLMANARTKYHAPIAGSLVEGVPHVEILREAKDSGADLIIIGTHGRTGIEHLLLGSVAERVVRGAAVPVITVPRGR